MHLAFTLMHLPTPMHLVYSMHLAYSNASGLLNAYDASGPYSNASADDVSGQL